MQVAGVDTLVKGLKTYTSNITVVATLSDSKKVDVDLESSKRKLQLLPYSNIKSSIASLSNDEEIMTRRNEFWRYLFTCNARNIW